MARLGACGQRSPEAVSSSTTIPLSPSPTATAPRPACACEGLKLATTSAIRGRSRSTCAAYVGLPMISSPSVRKQRFIGERAGRRECRAHGVEERDERPLGAGGAASAQDAGVAVARGELAAPRVATPTRRVRRAGVEHPVDVHGHRRTDLQPPPDGRLVAPRQDLDVAAAEVLELLGDQPRHVLHPVVVPADARLPHPALDAGDVVLELRVDLGVDGGAGVGVHEGGYRLRGARGPPGGSAGWPWATSADRIAAGRRASRRRRGATSCGPRTHPATGRTPGRRTSCRRSACSVSSPEDDAVAHVVEVDADEVGLGPQRLGDPDHLGEVRWDRRLDGSALRPTVHLHAAPVRIEEVHVHPSHAIRFHRDQLAVPVEHVEVVVVRQRAVGAAQELFDEDARGDVAVLVLVRRPESPAEAVTHPSEADLGDLVGWRVFGSDEGARPDAVLGGREPRVRIGVVADDDDAAAAVRGLAHVGARQGAPVDGAGVLGDGKRLREDVFAYLLTDVVACARLVRGDREVGPTVEEHLAADVVGVGAWPQRPGEVAEEEDRVRPDHVVPERTCGTVQPGWEAVRPVGHGQLYGAERAHPTVSASRAAGTRDRSPMALPRTLELHHLPVSVAAIGFAAATQVRPGHGS